MTQFHCSFKKNDSTDLACLDSSHTQFGTVSLLKHNEKQKAQQESRGKKKESSGTRLPSSFFSTGRFLDDFLGECFNTLMNIYEVYTTFYI